jgi:NADH dehydrogenase [ubiquinone] 1 alpha subcomplex assembly factor 7
VTVRPDAGQTALRLAQQIEASGPVSVAEYMRVANTAYYGGADPLGAAGDFITAPEISQMFGEMVGIWLSDIWLRHAPPSGCHYIELGPGRGTLAADALRTMKRFGWAPSAHFLENSPALRAKQLHAVPDASFHDNLDSLPSDAPLFIVANEFFDALPIQQMILTHSGWHERVVVRDRGSRFAAMPGAPIADNIIPEHFRVAAVGSIYETCPDALAIMDILSRRLAQQGGAMLTIDYGHTQPGLGSTLQAVRNHQYADPFADPGDCDLTAHVNFHDLAHCAETRGLAVAGPTEQGAWLSGLGIDQRAQSLLKAHPDRAADINAARNRLVQRESMGALFKVMASYAKEWPLPEGFGR